MKLLLILFLWLPVLGSDELNILHQHEYLGIGKAYIVPTKDPLEYDHPTDENLGTDFVLVWEG